MQPAAASDKTGVVLMMKGPSGATEVNTAEFWKQKEEDVPADQVSILFLLYVWDLGAHSFLAPTTAFLPQVL